MSDDRDKAIYQCPATKRFYDPLAVKRAITVASKGKFNTIIDESRATDPVRQAQGETALIGVARTALSLPPIDPATGAGVTDAVALEALTAFTRWLRGKGETAGAGPSVAPCTDCPQGH